MVTLERALFDTNEALHHMGMLPPEKYITVFSLSLGIALIIAMMPLIVRAMEWFMNFDQEQKYFPLIAIGIMFTILFLAKVYIAILLLLLLNGFIYIIYKYPQYQNIRTFLDKLF